MTRTVSLVAMLVAVVAWLVFSYWPAGAAALPAVAFGPGLPMVELAAALLAITAAIQAWIVYTTARSLTKPADAAQTATLRQFNLGVGAETVLTAAPLLITLALAVAIIFAARQ